MYLINNDIEFNCENLTLFSRRLNIEKRILSPSAKILEHLIINQGKNTSKEDLFVIGWGDKEKYVTMSAFYQNILLLRKALADLECDNIIITLPKRGYMFNSDISILLLVDPNNDIEIIKEIIIESKEIKNENYIDIEVKNEGSDSLKKNDSSLVSEKFMSEAISNVEAKQAEPERVNARKIKFKYLNRVKSKDVLLLIMLFVFILITFHGIYFYYKTRDKTLYNYKDCGNINGKNMYCEDSQKALDLKKTTELLNRLNLEDRIKDIYFTRDDYNKRLSVIACERKFIYFIPNECVSYYFVDEYM